MVAEINQDRADDSIKSHNFLHSTIDNTSTYASTHEQDKFISLGQLKLRKFLVE